MNPIYPSNQKCGICGMYMHYEDDIGTHGMWMYHIECGTPNKVAKEITVDPNVLHVTNGNLRFDIQGMCTGCMNLDMLNNINSCYDCFTKVLDNK